MAAESILEVVIELVDKTKSGFSSVTSSLSSLGKGLVNVATVGIGALIGGLTALGGYLAYSVGEAMEAQEVQAQLAAVLESTGGIAGVTADMANDLADSLSQVTRFGDEAILTGENMLLTFTNIGQDVFPQATNIMLDMSQALGQDLKSSAIQLGKALNDPITGVTALQRVGVTFTEEQKKMIASMVEAGDVAGAQTLILDELQREFGGSAVAAGQTFAGQLDILKNQLSNVAEGIGTALLPVLSFFVSNVIEPAIPIIQEFGLMVSSIIEGLAAGDPGVAFDSLREGIFSVGSMLGFSQEALSSFNDTLYNVWISVKDIIAIFQAGGFEQLFTVFEDGSTYFDHLFEAFGATEEQAQSLGAVVANFGQFITESLIPALSDLGAWLAINIPIAISALAEFWTGTLAPALATFWAWVQEYVFPILVELWNWLAINVPLGLETLRAFWIDTLQPALATFWTWVQETVFPLLSELWAWLQQNLPVALQTLSDFWTGTLQPALATVWAWVSGTLFPLLSDLWTWLETTIPLALQTLSDFWTGTLKPALEIVWGFVTESLIPLFSDLAELFNVALSLAVTALSNLWSESLYPAIHDVWDVIANFLKPAFDTLESFWTGTLKPAFEEFDFIDKLGEAFGTLSSAVKDLRDFLQSVITKLQAVGDAAPDWLIPGSPTPFEIGLRGIGDALNTLASDQLPAFNAALSAATEDPAKKLTDNLDLESMLTDATKIQDVYASLSDIQKAQVENLTGGSFYLEDYANAIRTILQQGSALGLADTATRTILGAGAGGAPLGAVPFGIPGAPFGAPGAGAQQVTQFNLNVSAQNFDGESVAEGFDTLEQLSRL